MALFYGKEEKDTIILVVKIYFLKIIWNCKVYVYFCLNN